MVAMLLTVTPSAMWAQTPHAQHSKPQVTNEQALAVQLQQLRRQVDQLQENMRQQGPQRASGGVSAVPQPPASQTGSMKSMPGGMMMGEKGSMPKGPTGRVAAET